FHLAELDREQARHEIVRAARCVRHHDFYRLRRKLVGGVGLRCGERGGAYSGNANGAERRTHGCLQVLLAESEKAPRGPRQVLYEGSSRSSWRNSAGHSMGAKSTLPLGP